MESHSYYAGSAPAPRPAPALSGAIRTDVCVIGAGLTGLSAAAALAAGGASVVVLEAGRVGDGASGRSGGQLIPGFRQGAVEIVRRFGRERARRLFGLTSDARTRTREIADARPCDLKETGHVTAASFARDRGWMEAEVRCLTDTIDYPHADLLNRDGLSAHVQSDRYHGGLLDRLGGHAHPLLLTRGLAAIARAAGATIYEHSAVKDVAPGPRRIVRTASGTVSTDAVVLACDAQIGSVNVAGRATPLGRRLMPVWSYSVATAPLPEALARTILPGDAAVSDTRFALDYFRLSADRRLLFSGGERYTLSPIDDIAGFVRPHLSRAFPLLADTPIDHAWPGTVAITTTRYPQVGRDGALWYAHGYSGHGMLLAQAAGRAIGNAIAGDDADFDLLASLPTGNWPGGAALRRPLYTAGMLWFSLKDRL